jgi:hypothetical protein
MASAVGGDVETAALKLYVVDYKGTPIAEIQEDGTEVTVKQNSNSILWIIGIGAIVLIGLTVFFLWRRQNINKNK